MHAPAERERIEALRRLWAQERQAARAREAEARRDRSLSERVAMGVAARDLRLDEVEAAPGGRLRLWISGRSPEAMAQLRVGPGDPVRLWRQDPDEADAVVGVIGRRTSRRFALLVTREPPEWLDDEGFRLDREAPEATFVRGDKALARYLSARPGTPLGRSRSILFGDTRPVFEPDEEPPQWFDEALNEPQRTAVRHALAARDIALILGPPGTGKTRTLVEVVRQAVDRGERILVAAASNAAVDHLGEQLCAADLPVLRLGHPARVSPTMEAHTLDHLLETTEGAVLARKWQREARELRRTVDARSSRGRMDRQTRREMLAQARGLLRDARQRLAHAHEALLDRCAVVCATAAGADTGLLGDREFDRVVIDEATQAPDPIALVALGRSTHAVLAGDPHQLPPTVVDQAAARSGLGRTFFERMALDDPGEAERVVRMLEVQHRMHETLMAFPSTQFYGGRLQASPTVAQHQLDALPGVASDPLRPGPLIFVDTSGKGWDEARTAEGSSFSNPGQADRVTAEVVRLVGRGLPVADLAVIAPYRAQVDVLRDHITHALEGLALDVEGPLLETLEIDSIDAFQGREKEAVVVDLVRSNPDGALGFLTDVRRMNVAMTRARRLLLVVGDSATLGRHPFYEAFLEAVEQRGAWISAWSDEAPPFEG